jgi:23S rRNA (cytidine1920-2'-O)/16S rRNA (cytidine1409-2'-O)-methyltransferase
LRDGGIYVGLIKPQFEAGRSALDKHGVVKNAKHRRTAVERVLDAAAEQGLGLRGLIRSPIAGGDGNVEYLAYYIKGKQSDTGHGAVQALFASERR